VSNGKVAQILKELSQVDYSLRVDKLKGFDDEKAKDKMRDDLDDVCNFISEQDRPSITSVMRFLVLWGHYTPHNLSLHDIVKSMEHRVIENTKLVTARRKEIKRKRLKGEF